ncbi:MAG: hypothetical protein ACP5G7_12965 [Anaerolineae bacterium]
MSRQTDSFAERVALQWALLAEEGVVPDKAAGAWAARRIGLARYGWDAEEDGDAPMSRIEGARDG